MNVSECVGEGNEMKEQGRAQSRADEGGWYWGPIELLSLGKIGAGDPGGLAI